MSFSIVEAHEQYVLSPERKLPLIAEVDLIVVGGNEAGLAAAWQAAQQGGKVMLLSDTTFLGGELMTKNRFDLLKQPPTPTSPFCKELFANPKPDTYPVTAANLLHKAGVRFLYNSRYGGAVIDPAGHLCGVVTANKAGLQVVLGKVIIDATPAGVVARDRGAAFSPWQAETLKVSRPRLAADRKKRELIELDAPMPSLNWPSLSQAEHALRESWYTSASAPFAHAMHFILPNHITGIASLSGDTLPPPDKLDLNIFRPAATESLYVISSAADLSRPAASALMHPVYLAEIGLRIGSAAMQDARLTHLAGTQFLQVKNLYPNASTMPGVALRQLAEAERPYRTDKPTLISQPAIPIPVWAEYDVVVAGSGPAGHAAAIAAARAGARTLMIEQAGYLGGSTTLGIKGFWRGYRHGFNQEWRGKGEPRYPELLRQAKVDVWYHTLGMGAVMRDNQVVGIEVATWLGRGAVLAKVIIDATGEGDICAAAGATTFYLNDGDLCLEEASFIGQPRTDSKSHNVGKNVRRDLYADTLPADPIDIAGFTIHHLLAAQTGGRQNFPMVQMRETRRIKGDWIIDELDVNSGRTYPDVIAVSASAFDPHGFYSSDYSFAGLMPMTKHVRDRDLIVYIPYRSILPAGLDGIIVAGRNFSATHDVQAIVRMNPDILNLGYAAGHAAAMAALSNTPLRKIDIGKLQSHLAEIAILPADQLPAITQATPPPTPDEINKAALDPAKRENLLTLARGGAASRLPLQQSLKQKPSAATAKALCLLGDPQGVPLLSEWIQGQTLPPGPQYAWDGFLTLPELDSAVWVVAIPRDPRATPALLHKLSQTNDQTGFNTMRALLMALGRIGDKSAAPELAKFLARPGIGGHRDTGEDPASLEARQFSHAMIELFAAAALYNCGDHQGIATKILNDYLDDWRGIFVRYAGHTLNPDK